MEQKKAAKNKIKITPIVVIIIFLILGVIGISLDEPSRVLNQATKSAIAVSSLFKIASILNLSGGSMV